MLKSNGKSALDTCQLDDQSDEAQSFRQELVHPPRGPDERSRYHGESLSGELGANCSELLPSFLSSIAGATTTRRPCHTRESGRAIEPVALPAPAANFVPVSVG